MSTIQLDPLRDLDSDSSSEEERFGYKLDYYEQEREVKAENKRPFPQAPELLFEMEEGCVKEKLLMASITTTTVDYDPHRQMETHFESWVFGPEQA